MESSREKEEGILLTPRMVAAVKLPGWRLL